MAIKHFKGVLGLSDVESEFDYDDSIFRLEESRGGIYLKYSRTYNDGVCVVRLPKGVRDTSFMFMNLVCKGLKLVDFDTSEVISMKGMFAGVVVLAGGTIDLGDKFDTSSVKCMSRMFFETATAVSGGINLGDKFDTSHVKDMSEMFRCANLPKNFTLGSHFDTSSVTTMLGMFRSCTIPAGLSLGDKFDTSRVKNMSGMFDKSSFPYNFSLGRHFNTSNVDDMSCMFAECKIPSGFTLGNKFDTSNVSNMNYMFLGTILPSGFTLGNKFDTSNVVKMRCMFSGTTFPSGFTLGSKFSMNKVESADSMFSTVINGLKIHDLGTNWKLNLVKVFQDAAIADDYKFPSWLNLKDYVDKGGTGIRYKGTSYDFPEIVLTSLFVENAMVTNSCRIDLLEMLKSGKSIERARLELSNSNSYDASVVDCCIAMVEDKLVSSCMETIKKLMIISKEGYSSYTISEVKEKALSQGYPKEIVYECILNYIGDQYLTL